MELKNEIILDGKVQKDIKILDEHINFNISAITGKCQTLENTKKNRYTFIRAVYIGEITEEVKNLIHTGNFIRVYGKLDSEQYTAKSGKIVYNKILLINKVENLNS